MGVTTLIKKALLFIIFVFTSPLFTDYPKIDIVYTWVDGSDPSWRKIKNKHLELLNKEKQIPSDSTCDSRFNDHHELKYSLRSILKHANFINHIFIVTMNQKPSWIKEHPMITFVDHKEIFLNDHDLPTFNSQAIESHLHRIKGLSNHFIYFNDDVFLGRDVEACEFFSDIGRPYIFLEPALSPKGPLQTKETLYRMAWRNTNSLLDRLYGDTPRFRLKHAPFALTLDLIRESETIFPEVFANNSSHKFRSETDCNIINGLLQYDWLHRQKCDVGHISNLMISLRSKKYHHLNVEAFNKLEKTKPATFCIEDVTHGQCLEAEQLMKKFLESKYPEKAPWEL